MATIDRSYTTFGLPLSMALSYAICESFDIE